MQNLIMNYDVVIVGAGPAGGQCARELSQAGAKVFLAEKAKDFSVNNYSSGGAPIEIMEGFQLPDSIVGTNWNTFVLHSSFDKGIWQSKQPLGVVLEFSRLRSFLADEAVKKGGTLSLGTAYHHHETKDGKTLVWMKNQSTSELYPIETKVLVDATGSEREVLMHKNRNSSNEVVATGIEYLVEVPEDLYNHYAHTLSFYMGLKWMPQGYSWIFPMEKNHLKVGVARYFVHEQYVPYQKSFQYYLNNMITECFKMQPTILDRHGKTLHYTYRQADPHFHENVVSIGDAVSTLNPLACEGIRHAMLSGCLASKHVLRYLEGDQSAFPSYVKEMRNHFSMKWRLCEFLMNRIYKEKDDEKVHLILKAFESLSTEQMMELGFHYDFKQGSKFFLHYFGLKTKHFFSNLFSR